MSTQQAFDPSRYLTKVGAADYLEVKWRLVWLREVHPDAEIVTSLHSDSDQRAVFSAIVSVPGGGSATGWGSETYNDFRDYLEKAETKAVGRALAALGFGTQFCDDFHYGSERKPVVDSPVDFASTRGHRMDGKPSPQHNGQRPQVGDSAITEKQFAFLWRVADDKGIDSESLHRMAFDAYGVPSLDLLTRRDASAFIDTLKSY